MNVLWARLGETGKDWRYVYKVCNHIYNDVFLPHPTAFSNFECFYFVMTYDILSFCGQALTVVEYLIANGSERAVDEIIEHTYRIAVCKL